MESALGGVHFGTWSETGLAGPKRARREARRRRGRGEISTPAAARGPPNPRARAAPPGTGGDFDSGRRPPAAGAGTSHKGIYFRVVRGPTAAWSRGFRVHGPVKGPRNLVHMYFF